MGAIFCTGFVMALTGAMAPGPLLTVAIAQSAKQGGKIGPLLILGHGILEFPLVLLIALGLGSVLHNNMLFAGVSFVGGAVLVYMAITTIKGLRDYSLAPSAGLQKKEPHPVLSGITVSVSNPYWLIWWLTAGASTIILAKPLGIPGVLAFFAGHITADLAWYSFVTYGIQLGGGYFDKRVIKVILFTCSLFLICFGIYFFVNGLSFLR
jgi:threonine/homoserine/homoserine lactone efflux protein